MFLIPPILATLDTDPNLHFYAESREQFQTHINPTFSSPADKNGQNLFSRLRIGAEYTFNPRLTAKVEYQNGHSLFWNQKQNGSFDSSDVSLAYAKWSGGGFTAIAGRQKIEIGQQRLIGSTEWLNLARSFDAGRLDSGAWSAWGGRLGVANNKPETARVEGLTHSDPRIGTTSFIAKHDLGKVSGIDVQTLDHFLTIKVGNITVDGEAAVQYGSNNGLDQRSWAWHVGATRPIYHNTTFRIEGNAASGGKNGTTVRTFDNLYPSNHDQYGLADLAGWKNMNEVAVKLQNNSFAGITLLAEGHAFSLRDASDGWYNAVGAVNPRAGGNFVDPTGGSGKDLGKEYDFSASYGFKSDAKITAGIAFFEPGNFVQALSRHSNQLTYGFLQFAKKF